METNALPAYDMSDNATGCCARFNPEGWDNRHMHFEDKKFVRATTKSLLHIPVNMGRVFTRVQEKIEADGAWDPDDMIVLSRELSGFEAEHFFSVNKDIEGEEMTTLSGDFVTRVFEGPYREAKDWDHEMRIAATAMGKKAKKVYFFYTACPKCAKAYGKNYVIGVVQV